MPPTVSSPVSMREAPIDVPATRIPAVGSGELVGADDAVTGPLPAIDRLDGRVRVHLDKGVTIVTLDGGLDTVLGAAIGAQLPGFLGVPVAIAVDVEHVTLIDREGLDAVLDALAGAAPDVPRCIVAPRLSGRLVLERWGISARLALFGSVADALQARAFAETGYGDGWDPLA